VVDVDRLLKKDLDERVGLGKPLSEHARLGQRSLEAYVKAGVRPRWMERVIEVDRGIAAERRRIADAYAALRAECGGDREAFARRWREYAAAQRFDDDLNELIAQHNAWYPIERDLPMDLRTRDFIRINGRSYRRPQLDAAWVLDQFPPS
jgi:hypothetical protein